MNAPSLLRSPSGTPVRSGALARATLALAFLLFAAGCAERAPEPYDPDVAAARLPGVVAALRAGRPEQALDEIAGLRRTPPVPEGLDHFEGVALADAGRPEQAVQAFERELHAHPGNALAAALAAESLLALGRLDEAAGHLGAARAGLPELPFLDFLEGRLALLHEDDEQAARAFAQFLGSDRTSARAAEAHHALAQIARRAGEEQAAAAHDERSQHLENATQYLNSYRQRLQESPDDTTAALGVGLVYLDLYRNVHADPALLAQAGDALEAALARGGDSIKVLYNLGFVRSVQGRVAEAQALHDRALALDPGHVGVLLNSGLLARRSGDSARALEHLAAAARLATTDAERTQAHMERAGLLEELGRPAEAADELAAVLALDPRDPHGVQAHIDRLRGG